MDTNLGPKRAVNYHCKNCYFNTSKKSHYTRHLATDKHKKCEMDTTFGANILKKYQCECGKIYKYSTGYHKHKKKCANDPPNTNLITPELVVELLKDNKEMKQILIQQTNTINELVKNGINNTIHNNTNNTFNLNLFLNETCKDAINMHDFINSIKLTFEDLMDMGELGYVGGLTKMVTSKLKELDVTQRPIHCTDKKRDTLHIKENGKWEKDDDKIKMRKVIGNVSNKYVKLLPDYQKSHPDCQTADSKLSDKYNKSIIAVMDGEADNKDKIIINISKVVTVEKKQYATASATSMID